MYWTSFLILLVFATLDRASGTCVNSFWTYYDGACYYFAIGKVTYDDAKASCAVMGVNANLVSVHSDAEQQFLNTKYGNVKYWLGMEASGTNWKWNDNTILVYTNWFSTAYATPTASACPMANYIAVTLGKWYTASCSLRDLASQGTLCKYYVAATAAPAITTAAPVVVTTTVKATTPTTGTVGITGVCVNSFWTYYNGACYYFATGKVTYADAQASCAAMGVNAHLVSVHSDAEQQFLNDKYGSVKYWLGFQQYATTYKWEDGTAYDYSNWLSASSASPSQCSMVNYLGSVGKWYSVGCDTRDLSGQGTLCKYEFTGTITSTTTTTTTTTTYRYICEDQEPSNYGLGQLDCQDLDDPPLRLCRDNSYRYLMSIICPLTCGQCLDVDCVDKEDSTNSYSICAGIEHLCNVAEYYDIMTRTCPVTCNRCPEARCKDLRDDCARSSLTTALCNTQYVKEQCMRTCNHCPGQCTDDSTKSCRTRKNECNHWIPSVRADARFDCPVTCRACYD